MLEGKRGLGGGEEGEGNRRKRGFGRGGKGIVPIEDSFHGFDGPGT